MKFLKNVRRKLNEEFDGHFSWTLIFLPVIAFTCFMLYLAMGGSV